jgi:hypothetical protein
MDVSINGRLDGLSLQLTSLKDEVKQLRSDLAETDRGLQHIDEEVHEIS